ncbi:viral a-type inclusion protein [Stylonychia lemnae]|uniref:Viral a-type inclusion protein n=1 Tax=Stylonychia lemnae TaxID=5949 RepID=A0A077ZPD3_STYLE|nr:viral a-type inclusion protein [Stylonychia lemnae]|eukprot:CDW71255.1 viral a-type inclusion protein [Stylonychia lemnae]
MRSNVKDLKEMVNKSRGVIDKRFSEVEVDEVVDLDESGLDTTNQSSKYNNSSTLIKQSATLKNPRANGTSSAQVNNSEIQNKFKKLQELSTNDKEVIEALQKKLQTIKLDHEALQQKYSALQRNYEGVSSYAASDKAEHTKLRTMREMAEKEAAELKKKNYELEESNKQLKNTVEQLNMQINDYKNKMDQKIRELEKLKDEAKKKDKTFEDKLNLVNQSNKQLNEQNTKMKSDLKKLQEENNELKEQVDSLTRQVASANENSNIIEIFRQKEEDFENQILQLQSKLRISDEDLHNRIIENEELLQISKKLDAMNNQNESKLKEVQQISKEQEKLITELQLKVQDLKASLKIEQENSHRTKQERDQFEKDYQQAQSEIDDLMKNSSQSSDMLSQRVKEMEIEKKALKAKIDQLDGDVYKLNRDKADIQQARDKAYDQVDTYKQKLSDLQKELDQFKESNSNLQLQLQQQKQSFSQKDKEQDALYQELKQFKDQIEQMMKKQTTLERDLQANQKQAERLVIVKKGIMDAIAKMKKSFESIDTTLSCLSCLEFLNDPLTLVCGHSICQKCFNTHSDPKSKDSLVFCEECKIETKNKNLRESKVIKTICDKFLFTKGCIEEVKILVQ